jgi:tight adherence protein C
MLLARRSEYCSIAHALLHDDDDPARGAPLASGRGSRFFGAGRGDLWAVSIGSLSFGALRGLLCGFSPGAVLIAMVLGAFAGRLYMSRQREACAKKEIRSLEFYLPAVMERIVMAVGSGLDIVPALQEASRGGKDPVSGLLAQVVRLSEGGTPVDAAFESVAAQTKSVSVRHAMTHLALAHRQGGEIVRPLKELSDATQTAYQETVEEMIAKLPVKAVLPLVLTFTGLIICFLTVPLMQVGAIATKVAHVAR